MTTNQTIDGVPRDYVLRLTPEAYSVMLGMVEHCLNIRACMGMDEGFKDFDTEEEHGFVKELRAMLDAPSAVDHDFSGVMIGGVLYARECRGCGLTYVPGEVEIDESKMGGCIQEHRGSVPANNPIGVDSSGCSDRGGSLSKPAAQPQGEPVAKSQWDVSSNPVLGYADSYRAMARQGVETVSIWSVITVLERNIAPLYAAQSHGEPVYQLSSAYASPPEWTDQDKETYGAYTGRDGWITRILYSEQPAPVAVVLPERMSVPRGDLQPFERAEAIKWNACIDEVTRLNAKSR